jgi:hypothetical protein
MDHFHAPHRRDDGAEMIQSDRVLPDSSSEKQEDGDVNSLDLWEVDTQEQDLLLWAAAIALRIFRISMSPRITRHRD